MKRRPAESEGINRAVVWIGVFLIAVTLWLIVIAGAAVVWEATRG